MTKQDKKKFDKLIKMVEEERARVAGYNELAKLHTAYISVLLKRLGATSEESKVIVTNAEITEAMEKYEARAIYSQEEKSQGLYCADKE